MAKYTIELREIISTFGEAEVKKWFKDYELSDYLTPEEINVKVLEALRCGGVVNSEDDIAKRLDGETEAKSDVVPIEYKKDGTLSSRSSVMTGEELQEISSFVNKKVRQLGKEILDGNIEVNPYKSGQESACTYCTYKGVCGFEKNTPGYGYRSLQDLDKEEVMERIREENGGEIYT